MLHDHSEKNAKESSEEQSESAVQVTLGIPKTIDQSYVWIFVFEYQEKQSLIELDANGIENLNNIYFGPTMIVFMVTDWC